MGGVGTSTMLGPEILLPSDLSSAIKCSRSTHARCMPTPWCHTSKHIHQHFIIFCLKSSSLHPPRVEHAIRLFSVYVKEFSRFGWLSKPHRSPWTISSYSPLHHPSHPSPLSTLIFLFPPNLASWSRKCNLIKLLRKKCIRSDSQFSCLHFTNLTVASLAKKIRTISLQRRRVFV